MRTSLIALNAIIAVFFMAAFVFTFAGRKIINATARDFATAKTAEYAKPLVALAEQAAASPMVKKLLSEAQEEVVAREIEEYHRNPAEFVARLTGKASTRSLRLPSNPLTMRIDGWKIKIRAHYGQVLGRVLGDLRIFTGTNFIAALLAAACAWRGNRKPRAPLVTVSALLLAATLFSSFYYIDSFSFFHILFDSFLGWWYPVLLTLIFTRLYIESR